jgi:hypothetical protein
MNIHPLEILPPKKSNKKIEFPQIPSPLQQPPFTLEIIAPTKSGKSVIILNILKNVLLGYSDGVFDEIYYISPTLELDETLKIINEDETIIKITDDEELENLDDILKDIMKSQKEKNEDDRKHVLIVLDDMIDYLKKSKVLGNLTTKNRHLRVSIILVSQVFNSIPVKARKNGTSYIFSNIYNQKDLNDINEEIGSNFPDFMDYYKEATKEKYNFLFVDVRSMSLWHNFKSLLWSK